MSAAVEVVFRANLTKLRSNLEQAKKETGIVWRHHLSTLRKGAELSILFINAAGSSIDATLSMGIQAGLLLIDFATRVQAFYVGAAPITPWAIAQATALGAATVSMSVAVYQMQAGREQLARRMYTHASFWRAWSYN